MDNKTLLQGGSGVREPGDARLIAASHVVEVFDHDAVLLDALECFVESGLGADEGVVVFATSRHLHELEQRLHASGLQVDRARWQGRYIALLADEVLRRVMVDGRPDRELFNAVVGEFLARAKSGGRRIRVFGEMVNMLMARGDLEATIQLEGLWNETCCATGVLVFCGYSRALFTGAPAGAIDAVATQHHLIIEGTASCYPTACEAQTRLLAHLSRSARVSINYDTSKYSWPRQACNDAEALALEVCTDRQTAKLRLAVENLAIMERLHLLPGDALH